MTQPVSSRGADKALAGIKVLDLTSVIMGPVCTQILGGYGAEIVKVESPEGDIMRHAGAQCEPEMGSMFMHVNHYKKSIVIDLKSDEGRQLLWKLIPDYDVLVHNIRRDAIERLGFGYDAVRAAKPDMIYVALSGYGEDGPYAAKPAFDDIIQAEAGLASLYALQTGNEPAYLPSLIVDRHTGTVAAHRVLASLFRRQACGQGEYINVSMFETMAEFVLSDHLGGKTFDPASKDTGYSRLLTRHRRPYRTSDGYIAAVVYNDKHWKAFFKLIGKPDMFADSRFGSAAGRASNYDTIYKYLSDVFQTDTSASWIASLTAADIPCAMVNDIEMLTNDPHLEAGQFFSTYSHDRSGVTYQAVNKNTANPGHQPPGKGQHTVEVLASHGFTPETIQALLKSKAIQNGLQDEE
ncbi:CoA transferase [Alcaligenaceae bacterium]|nr:CoA transferase [Alcaligenaceae bacterium]